MSKHPGQPTFRTAGFFRTGYSTGEVDGFLDEVSTAIARGLPVPDIATQRFTAERGGYAMDEVDAFLDDLLASLGGTT